MRDETTTLWQDYENGKNYQASTGLSVNVPRYVDFFEGRQWPKPTENTKNMPRPVINIIKTICRNKKSAILSSVAKIVYKAEDITADVELFNRFAEYIQKELGQDKLDKLAIDDGVKKGPYFYHYFWDSEAHGKDGIKEGGLRGEIIDCLNIFFADPTQKDEQKQKWILIATREDVESVRAKCDSDVDKNSISGDESESKYSTVEQEGDKLCTVLTRYFRQNGEVYCEKATKSVVVNKPFPIAPDIEAVVLDDDDAPNNDTPDNHKKKPLIDDYVKAPLYPIVAGNYEEKEGSIYGIGEVEGIIPNQKAINFLYAMALLNAQEVAWGKFIVTPNALQGQVITNEPGQVITDHTGTGQGIKKMTEQPLQSLPIQLADSLLEATRMVTGATEVMSGEVIGSNMSGAAIAQLQAQAQLPIEELRDAFWLVKEKQGKVLAQFFKLYYTQKEFTYDDENEQKTAVFDSSTYANTQIDVVVETVSGTKASAAGDIAMLDSLLAGKFIDIETYIKAYPQDALSNRSEIIKGIQAAQDSEKAQMAQLIEQLQAQLQQSAEVIQRQSTTVDKVMSVIQENRQLKAQLADLYTEADYKIKQANAEIEMGNAKIAETTQDASMFAQALAGIQPQG